MPYMIDGHNLIPKIPGLSLRDMDDEMQLVELLQEFCRREHKQVIVYFDKAPPGGGRARVFGQVTARFVPEGRTADEAIGAHLRRLGNAARNWTVVSSDRQVQVSARAVRAGVMLSSDFARLLGQAQEGGSSDSGEASDVTLSEGEVDEWLQLFGDE